MDSYLRLWRRPVRQARFFDDHFEISGWNANINSDYSRVEGLKKTRSIVGDFRTDSSVTFSVRDDPNLFTIPNRKNRGLKLDLYSWLRQKSMP